MRFIAQLQPALWYANICPALLSLLTAVSRGLYSNSVIEGCKHSERRTHSFLSADQFICTQRFSTAVIWSEMLVRHTWITSCLALRRERMNRLRNSFTGAVLSFALFPPHALALEANEFTAKQLGSKHWPFFFKCLARPTSSRWSSQMLWSVLLLGCSSIHSSTSGLWCGVAGRINGPILAGFTSLLCPFHFCLSPVCPSSSFLTYLLWPAISRSLLCSF